MTSSAAELAAESSPSHAEALTPQLAAQLLHLDALQASGVNGAGETIAIAARSNVRNGTSPPSAPPLDYPRARSW